MKKKYKRKIKNKSNFPLIITISATIVFAITLGYGIKINPTRDQTKSVLGTTTALEKQEKWIQNGKIAEANGYLSVLPNPISKIQMEGKLSTDPNQIKTVNSLGDVKKIFVLSYAYKITGDTKYLNKSRDFILAWANTYKATGNSIDESHLEPLFEGYSWIKDDLSTEDRNKINIWLSSISDKELNIKYNDDRDINNWNSHRINIIGQIGFLTNNKKFTDYALNAFKQQIQTNLFPDGSSIDYVARDALHYQCYDIFGLLLFAKTSTLHGINLYNYQSKSGASLRKSVHFLYPYFSGEKTHVDFANSTVAWDRKTNSVNKLTNWDPKTGLYILELANFFDDSTLPLIQKIRNNYADYPSFEVLLATQQKKEIPSLGQ